MLAKFWQQKTLQILNFLLFKQNAVKHCWVLALKKFFILSFITSFLYLPI